MLNFHIQNTQNGYRLFIPNENKYLSFAIDMLLLSAVCLFLIFELFNWDVFFGLSPGDKLLACALIASFVGAIFFTAYSKMKRFIVPEEYFFEGNSLVLPKSLKKIEVDKLKVKTSWAIKTDICNLEVHLKNKVKVVIAYDIGLKDVRLIASKLAAILDVKVEEDLGW